MAVPPQKQQEQQEERESSLLIVVNIEKNPWPYHFTHTIRLFIRVWLQEEKGSRETFTQTRFVFCSNAHTNTVFSTHFYHTNHWRALLIFPALITQHRIGGYKRETPFYLVPSAMYTISIAMQMCLQHCRAWSKNNLFPFSWLKHTSTGIFYFIRGAGYHRRQVSFNVRFIKPPPLTPPFQPSRPNAIERFYAAS